MEGARSKEANRSGCKDSEGEHDDVVGMKVAKVDYFGKTMWWHVTLISRWLVLNRPPY